MKLLRFICYPSILSGQVLSFVICALFSSMVLAQAVSLPDYTGFVNDFAGALDSVSAQKLEALARDLEQRTSVEMAIAVVKTVEPLDPKTYAVELFEKWKIGKKGKDNGLLILLAMAERRIEIEAGYGLEGVINDAKAGEILDKYAVPFFKAGKYREGLYNTSAALAREIGRSTGPETQKPVEPGGGNANIYIMIVIIIAIALLSAFASGIFSGLIGAGMGASIGYIFAGIFGAVIGALIGFVLSYTRFSGFSGGRGGWGGGSFGGSGGGFGGFGGGGSGGGGSGRSW